MWSSPYPYQLPPTLAPPPPISRPTPDLTPHTSPHHLTPPPQTSHLITPHLTPSPHTPDLTAHPTPPLTPHTPPASKARGERWGLSLKSSQPQSCLWKAPQADGLPPGGPPALRRLPLSPPSAPVLPSPAPPLAPLLEAEHHTPPRRRHLVSPRGAKEGPRAGSVDSRARRPWQFLGWRHCGRLGPWGPRRSRLSSGDIWEGRCRAHPLGFQNLLEARW